MIFTDGSKVDEKVAAAAAASVAAEKSFLMSTKRSLLFTQQSTSNLICSQAGIPVTGTVSYTHLTLPTNAEV